MSYTSLITKNANKGLIQGDATTGAMRFSIDGGQTWKEISADTFTGVTDIAYFNGVWTITYSDSTTDEINVGVDNFLSSASFDGETNVLTLTMVNSDTVTVDLTTLISSKVDKVAATVDTILTADGSQGLKATSKVFGGASFNATPNTSTIPSESSIASYIASILSDYVTENDLTSTLSSFATDEELSTGLSGKVDKDGTKVLSDNNYDSASKTKLDNLANITTIGANLSLDSGTLSVNVSSGGTSITWHIIDTNTTASANHGYMIDASASTVDLTLPSSITLGDTIFVKIIDSTNTVTIKRNGNNIEGVSEDLIVDTSKAGFHLVASDATNGWVITTEISGITDTNAVSAGTIETFANDIPEGFIELEASKTVSRTTYASLYSVIGTKYGKGDGTTTFGIPDAKIDIETSILSDVIPVAKYASSIVTLLDGRILVVGGYDTTTLTSCHIGTVNGSAITWASATALPAPLYAMTTTVLADGRILVVGGGNDSGGVNTIYFGEVSGNTISWTLSASTYPIVIRQHSAVLMDDGRLVCLGGYSSDITTAVYIGTISGNTVSWAAGTVLGTARRGMKAIKTSSDSFLIIGGLLGANITGDCTFGTISGNTITWTTSDALPVVRFWPSCGLLKDNSILCVGGSVTANASTATTTIYRGQVNAIAKNIAWSLLGHIQITTASADGTLTNNAFIIAGGIGTGGTSDKTQIIPLRRQGIKI